MMIETQRAIARTVAKHLVETFGREIENLTVWETLGDEVPGLDEDLLEQVTKLVFAYIDVAQVSVFLNESRVNDDGTVISESDYLKQPLEF
jgi:hypothetical protein